MVESQARFWRRMDQEMAPFSGAPLDQIEKKEIRERIKQAEHTGAMTISFEEYDRKIQERYDDFLKWKGVE